MKRKIKSGLLMLIFLSVVFLNLSISTYNYSRNEDIRKINSISTSSISLSPIGIWHLNDESSLIAQDSSSNNYDGYLYNMVSMTWTPLDYPGADETVARRIDGNNIVGYYEVAGVSHGFLYDVMSATWTSLDYPGADETALTSIDGNNVVGYYAVADVYHGFIASQVPEPTTLFLLGAGLAGVGLLRGRFKN